MMDIKDTIQDVLAHYNLGTLVSYTDLSDGYANLNYKVVTNKTSFLFRVCKEQKYEMIEYEMKLMESLKKIKFPTAYPLSRKDNNFISSSNQGNIVLYEFKDGNEPKLNGEVTSEIAKALGRLSLLPDKDIHIKQNVINLPDSLKMIDSFPKVKCQYPEIFKNFEECIIQLHDALLINLPKGVIHADLFPDNTLFIGNKLSAVIDFEEANYDHLLFDIGMAINGFCFNNNTLNNELRDILISEYQKLRPLSNLEKGLINYYIIWGAVGMAFWHLRHLVKRPFKTQQNRVEELLYRAKILFNDKQFQLK